jgi:hypothetical protein
MRSPAFFIVVLCATLLVSACRQADGPVPTPDANVQEELRDVTKDLQNVHAKDPQAPADLASDIGKYTDDPTERPAVDELTRRVARVLPGSKLTEQAAQRLAVDLWAAVAARQSSERQVEALQNDVQSVLMSVGIPEPEAQQVAAQVGDVQRAVNDRPRRWYELF